MKINKKSWHYKLIRSIMNEPEYYYQTICKYFWALVGSILAWIGILLVIAILSTGFVYVAFIVPLASPGLFETFWSMVLWTFMGYNAIKIARGVKEYYSDNFFFTTIYERPRKKEQKPNIVAEWLKAKKAKICPFIDFE